MFKARQRQPCIINPWCSFMLGTISASKLEVSHSNMWFAKSAETFWLLFEKINEEVYRSWGEFKFQNSKYGKARRAFFLKWFQWGILSHRTCMHTLTHTHTHARTHTPILMHTHTLPFSLSIQLSRFSSLFVFLSLSQCFITLSSNLSCSLSSLFSSFLI